MLPRVSSDTELQYWLRGLDECRAQSLRILAIGQILLSWAMVIPYLVVLPNLGWTILALFLGAIGALVVPRVNYRAAVVTTVVSEYLAALAALKALDVGFTEWTFAIPVATTAILLDSGWACLVAAAVSATLLLNAGGPAPWTNGYALGGITLAWTTAFISWLGLRPLEQTLSWAISSHHDARARAEEAERHRGELGRLVKSLNETHERLERLTLELERARQAAEHARTLKARFAAYISHELRTPLNLIIGFSEMMAMAPHTYEGEVLPAAYRGDVNAIYQSARHLSALINDVLDLSQIDAHRMALDRDDVTISDVICEAVETVAAAYAEKGLWIKTAIDEGLPLLYVDRTRIRQVLINLLGNALRFTDRGGVTVRATLAGSDVVTSVVDTGVGIPPDDLPHLFDDFRQVEQDGAERGEGSGLGLAIARRFIGMHGGWMRAESQPGHGTTMSFGLPADHVFLYTASLTATNDPHHPDNGALGPAGTGASSLPVVGILGGDPWLLRATQRYLDGYRVLVIDDEKELRQRRWQREGVVALIIAAPSDASGWERLQAVTEHAEGVPVLCCSIRGGREAIHQLGIADYVDKPVPRERLAQVLDRLRLGRGSRTVLVVDDDHEMVRLLTRMIHAISRRYRVLKAYGGAMALELMRETSPDLVLLDLLMHDIDGYSVLQKMRADEQLKDVPVVVVTARGLEEDAILAGMFGLARTGGFPAGELMRCLQATLDNLSSTGLSSAGTAIAPTMLPAAPPG